MGLLERLHRLDSTQPEPEPEPSPETAEKVSAILSVLTPYLDPDSAMSNMLFTIARRELVSADGEKLDTVIRGVLDAAEKLRPWAVPEPAPAAAAGDGA